MKKIVTAVICAAVAVFLAASAFAAVGTVVEAPKTDKAPNMEQIDASWGQPLIHVDKNSPNTDLVRYWGLAGTHEDIVPEDVEFDLYVCWTSKCIYLGVKTRDDFISGHVNADAGDGIEFFMMPLDALTLRGLDKSGLCDRLDGTYQTDVNKFYQSVVPSNVFAVTLGFDDYSVATKMPYLISYMASNDCEKQIYQEEDILDIMIEIPLRTFGGVSPDSAAGTEFGIALMRMSMGDPPDLEGKNGWLEWGKYTVQSKCSSVNTIILSDGSAPADTTPADTEDTEDTTVDVTPNLDGVSSWALAEVESGIKEGLVPENLQANYTSPVTRGAVAQMFVNLLEKTAGKSIDDIMAEKGVAINEGAFTDTTDKAVLAANALGIINGTGSGKFSPDG
ncbi:MAG: S-layer homology domain-containing protein, partial [Clostridia bacterium]|nr:S-layer homology domain-containing protein [Clostridia bacterium]